MRRIEDRAAAIGLPSAVLMENAGLEIARWTKRLLGGIPGRRILVLVGPGNNGGDGLVAARHLHDWGAEVQICMPKPRSESDSNYRLLKARKVSEVDLASEGGSVLDDLLQSADAVIDAFFGTGKARPLGGTFREVLLKVQEAKQRRSHMQLISVDLPSGVNADNGAVDDGCPAADTTITLGYPKPGHFAFPGAAKIGRLIVGDIGIPDDLAEDIAIEVTTEEQVAKLVPERPLNSHKGTFGRLLVVGGSLNYIGAACLACEGAMRVGTGLVTLATPATLHGIMASKLLEVTYELLAEARVGVVSPDAADHVAQLASQSQATLLGCGIGRSTPALDFLRKLLPQRNLGALVLDADGLNLLSEIPDWWQTLAADAVLTPHPKEMSRLGGLSVEQIQSNRIGTASEAAARWNKIVVLKGAYTVVAEPGGRTYVNPWANPGLASAGTGDVLAGVIAGLAAQGLPLVEAAVLGVYVHGEAAEIVRQRLGATGMIASDLLSTLPVVMKNKKADSSSVHT